MKQQPSSDLPEGSDLDPRHEAVWRLLGRASMQEPDAWFTARALARCRSEKQSAATFALVLRWAFGSGLGVCLAVTLLITQVTRMTPVQTRPLDHQKSVQEAFEVMASIDNSDSDTPASPASWQDSSL